MTFKIPTPDAICKWLLSASALQPADIQRAVRLGVAQGISEDEKLHTLLRLGAVKDGQMAAAYAHLLGVARLADEVVEMAPAVTERFARHHGVVTLSETASHLRVAAAVPLSAYALSALGYHADKTVEPVIATAEQVAGLIEQAYGAGRSAMGALVEALDDESVSDGDIEHLKDMASEAPVVRMVNLMLQHAVDQRASDIHVEPFESQLKVRYRVDGVLLEGEAPPSGYAAAIISRLKIMARLDIAERRLPQDGRIMLRMQGRELDLRVSTVPTSFGESVVMRLLDRQTVSFDFASLGISAQVLRSIEQLLARPHGIFLVTGPTGSGKTTTLYTALSGLNSSERKIITVEDPVEYQLTGINQIQVKPAIGLGFATALRSIVRQDPDVIMIGEMRDLETCSIAIQSSLTGHLVLSSLHTNSAAASITRLLDMGVEGYLLASTLQGILAQRLVRRLDPRTRIAFEAPAELVERHQLQRYTEQRPILLYRPDEQSPGGGYHGRSAITELLVMDDELRSLLMRQSDAASLEAAARDKGLVTLYEEGLRQALAGITSLEEVLRVTGGD
ncbi:TPA: type II secretion system ATPase GspE [Pseudomonas putida]|uniref:Type II secretion system protein E n=1 Tax=Pseudomonas putida S13.1.2 TaxID=1384061 RepID=A0AAU8RW47_PSEPU|nr:MULTISPECIES: type II secretion system ATPase GspE [Pseudomonas]AJQ47511.1 general secretion pathway protein GspE [Pseudomonas putida S13.1.2]MCS4061302.1 general secretion pathway protein E [Pseudomonas putida]MDD1993554.1 type II secretion system ATPase GspE [Pseudomonas putida]TCP79722.1 type II secretion system protein E (GspE) [Pseudomonas putida]HDS0916540.1 type II secretion system ATPase GspE [Pseudomonas putida]